MPPLGKESIQIKQEVETEAVWTVSQGCFRNRPKALPALSPALGGGTVCGRGPPTCSHALQGPAGPAQARRAPQPTPALQARPNGSACGQTHNGPAL